MPEFIEEVREETGTAARRFHTASCSAPARWPKSEQVTASRPMSSPAIRCATSSGLPHDLSVDLLVIGATGHSALYERMLGSRADRIVQLAQCPGPRVVK